MINNSSDEKVTESIKELVIARIEARMSKNLRLSVGSIGSLDKDELIQHVKDADEIGKQIVQVHMNFIKAQATGQLTSALISV